MSRKITVITGLTSSGKTNLAIQLAKTIDAEIICADSRAVFKDFDIVSAKPTIEERESIVHHLIDVVSPNDDFSAGDFVKLAQNVIEKTKKNIIIAGGTWFYIKSLLDCDALLDCPKDTELRNELDKLDSVELWNKLKQIDPARAELIHPNNRDKVIRSIEMCMHLKKPVSEVLRPKNTDYKAKWFMPDISRQDVYERINKRVDLMVSQGLYEEWQKNKELYPNSKVLKNTIGYQEFFDFGYDEAVEKIKQHTRNFAKRQITYFKSRDDIVKIKNVEDILENLSF